MPLRQMHACVTALAIMSSGAEQQCGWVCCGLTAAALPIVYAALLHATLQSGKVQKLRGGVHRKQLQE